MGTKANIHVPAIGRQQYRKADCKRAKRVPHYSGTWRDLQDIQYLGRHVKLREEERAWCCVKQLLIPSQALHVVSSRATCLIKSASQSANPTDRLLFVAVLNSKWFSLSLLLVLRDRELANTDRENAQPDKTDTARPVLH